MSNDLAVENERLRQALAQVTDELAECQRLAGLGTWRWEIAADLSTVSLKNVYDALGAPTLLAIGVHLENPSCLVEQAVNRSLTGAFAEAEALLIDRLGTVTLAQLAEDFRAGMARHRAHHKDHNHV